MWCQVCDKGVEDTNSFHLASLPSSVYENVYFYGSKIAAYDFFSHIPFSFWDVNISTVRNTSQLAPWSNIAQRIRIITTGLGKLWIILWIWMHWLPEQKVRFHLGMTRDSCQTDNLQYLTKLVQIRAHWLTSI